MHVSDIIKKLADKFYFVITRNIFKYFIVY